MINIVSGAALAAAAFSAAIVPVTSVGSQGWTPGGNGKGTISMAADTAEFVAPAGFPVDVKLYKVERSDISHLVNSPVVEGDNAHLVFEAYVGGKFTSIVYNTETPGTVHLTWGSSPDQYLPEAKFIEDVRSGALKGFTYRTQIGHTNTGDTNGETASVDYIEYNGTRYDFGAGIPSTPIEDNAEYVGPGNGNRTGLGNGHGQGHAHGHLKNQR